MPSLIFAKKLMSSCDIETSSLVLSVKSDSKTLIMSAGVIISLTWVLQTKWTSDLSSTEDLIAGMTCFVMIR